MALAQVSESFSTIPTSSSTFYQTRDWTGDDGFDWQATNARTDQTLNGKAITIRGNGHLINNGGSIANGCGVLTFEYKRAFSGNSTMQVYINGSQIGSNITVSSTTASTFSETVNVSGNIDIEIKNITSGKRIVIDDLAWTGFASSNDTDTEVYDTGSQPAAANISSTATTSGAAVDVFNMTIEDQGTADGLPTKVTNIRIKPHTTNTADWTDHIQGIVIDDGSTFLNPSSVTITDTEIDITLPSTELNVADAGSTDVTIAVYLNTSNIQDGAIFSCYVDAANHGFTADASGSTFVTPFTLGDFNSNDFTMDVEATELQFQVQPSDILQGAVMSPAVKVAYTDLNGNIDVDYDGLGATATLSATGATLSGSTTTDGTPINGVMTFSDISFSTSGSGVTLTVTDAAGITNPSITSNPFNVTAPPQPICYTEDFVDFSDWTNGGTTTDNSVSHCGVAAPCRAVKSNTFITSPEFDHPAQLEFHQDASGGGNGNTATIDYKVGAGSWTSLYSFAVSTAGVDESVDLSNVGGVDLSTMNNVSFRFNSSFNTWYLDDVVIRGSTCTLPIKLLAFTVSTKNDQNILNWTTSAENNNDYMAVERSDDGRKFTELGRVAGAGTSYKTQNYSFVDEQPLNGINYYRLRQVDLDGQATYHKVVSILVSKNEGDIRIAPTAVIDQVVVYLPGTIKSTAQMNIYDMTGKLWHTTNLSIGNNQATLNMGHLPNGQYILQLVEGTHLSTVRFNKL